MRSIAVVFAMTFLVATASQAASPSHEELQRKKETIQQNAKTRAERRPAMEEKKRTIERNAQIRSERRTAKHPTH